MKAVLPFVLLCSLPSSFLAESSLPKLRVISRKLREQVSLFHPSQDRHHESWSTRSRFLQEDVCTDPSDVFDDDDLLLIFSPSAEPECFCEDIDGSFDFDNFFAENPLPNSANLAEVQDWIDTYNVFIMNLEGGEQYGCGNECSICAGESCAVVETNESTRSRAGFEQNLTLADFAILADAADGAVDSFVEDGLLLYESRYTSTTCYTPAVEDPTVMCLTFFSDFTSDEGIPLDELEQASVTSTPGCMVTVGGIECSSCEIDLDTFCFLLDCTNIEGNAASLNFCSENRADYPGVYNLLYDFEVNYFEYTLGSCGDDAPIVVPSPMESTTTDAPMSSRVMEPATTDAPMSSPVMEPATTVAPMSSPVMEPATTDAPVPSPMMSSPVMGPMSSLVTEPTADAAPAMTPMEPTITANANSSSSTRGTILVWIIAAWGAFWLR